MKLTFFGGTRSVTGGNHLLEHNGVKILIDCGMLQGEKFVEDFNYQPFPYDPAEIDYLFVTHAHIDHIGRIPKLVRDGFKGKIIATGPTIDLAQISLRDSVRIVAREAQDLGLEPFFTMDDVEATDKYFTKQNYNDVIKLKGGGQLEIFNGGHVLGSAIFKITYDGTSVTFLGDLGNNPSPLMPAPQKIGKTDYVVTDSVYGDRTHDPAKIGSKLLKEVIEETISRGGTLMIPSFALERTQILLFYINNMVEAGEIPSVPIFIDSPLASKMTDIYRKSTQYFKREVQKQIRGGDDIFEFPNLEFTIEKEESKAIANHKGPKIIIAGNGMSTAGRILFHEKVYLANEKNTVLIVGYQVEGSLGRQLLDKKSEVKIMKKVVPVRAHVHQISAFSAHADNPQLRHFMKENIENKPKKIFVIQGGENAAEQLASDLREDGFDAYAPIYKESFEL